MTFPVLTMVLPLIFNFQVIQRRSAHSVVRLRTGRGYSKLSAVNDWFENRPGRILQSGLLRALCKLLFLDCLLCILLADSY